MIYQVYALYAVRSDIPYYVGITRTPLSARLASHLSEARAFRRNGGAHRLYEWILSVWDAGGDIDIRLLSAYQTKVEALNHEILTINEFSKINPQLTNVSGNKSCLPGYDVCPTCHRKIRPEADRKKIKASYWTHRGYSETRPPKKKSQPQGTQP